MLYSRMLVWVRIENVYCRLFRVLVVMVPSQSSGRSSQPPSFDSSNEAKMKPVKPLFVSNSSLRDSGLF